MDRYDYFLKALSVYHQAYRYKAWIISCFTKCNLPKYDDLKIEHFDEPEQSYGGFGLGDDRKISGRTVVSIKGRDRWPSWAMLFEHEGHYAFIDDEGEIVKLDGATTDEPLLYVTETIWAKAEHIECLKEDVESTCGRVLWNVLTSDYPFNGKVPFINKPTSFSDVEKVIAERLVNEDDRVTGDSEVDEKIFPGEVENYYRGAGLIEGLSGICVPSATPFTLTPSKEAMELLDSLLEEYKDRLTEPEIAAMIGQRVMEADRAYIEQDPDKGFYQSAKYFDVVRKKMLYMWGGEAKFTGDGIDFIPDSLDSGWNMEYFPQMNNSLRDGSHSRGALTALGGEKTKVIFRATAGSKVAMEDCGTRKGLDIKILERNAKKYIGFYVIEGSKDILIDENNLSEYIGKTVKMRHVGYCNSKFNSYCMRCAGEFLRGKERSISAECSTVGTTLMSRFMAKMHGTAASTVKLDLTNALQ